MLGFLSVASINRRIFAATVVVGTFNAIVLSATVARDLVIAYQFGTGDIADAFLISLLVPSIAVQVAAVALASATVPQAIKVRGSAPSEAISLFASLATVSLIGLAAIAALLATAQGPIISLLASGFSEQKMELTRFFYLLLLPGILLQGWSTFVGFLINAAERFAVVAAAPVLRPIALIIALFAMPAVDAAWLLVLGYLVGAVLEALIIGFAATRVGIPIWPRWYGISDPLRIVLREFGSLTAGSAILAGAQFANQYLATLLPSGSVATLSYGTKLVTILLGLGALPLGVAVLPHFSFQASESNWRDLRNSFLNWNYVVIAITVPVMFLCVFYSVPIVQLLFQRGAFVADDTARVVEVQRFLLLQVPFYLVGILSVRALIALQKNRHVALLACVNAGTNLLGCALLMRPLGIAGIALAVSIGHFTASVLAAALVIAELKRRVLPMTKK
jgi:putative peptidoglycan lipid II flippase